MELNKLLALQVAMDDAKRLTAGEKLRAAVAHVEAGRPAARAWEMLEAGHAEAVEVMSAAERPPTARPEARTAAARAGADSGGAGAARGGGAGLGAGGAGGGGA